MLDIMRAILSGSQFGNPEDLEAVRTYSPITSSKIIAIIAIHQLGHYGTKLRYESVTEIEN